MATRVAIPPCYTSATRNERYQSSYRLSFSLIIINMPSQWAVLEDGCQGNSRNQLPVVIKRDADSQPWCWAVHWFCMLYIIGIFICDPRKIIPGRLSRSSDQPASEMDICRRRKEKKIFVLRTNVSSIYLFIYLAFHKRNLHVIKVFKCKDAESISSHVESSASLVWMSCRG